MPEQYPPEGVIDLMAALKASLAAHGPARAVEAAPPTADQPPPEANALPAVWDLVIRDMQERDALGREELLDAVAYCRQEIEERSSPRGAEVAEYARRLMQEHPEAQEALAMLITGLESGEVYDACAEPAPPLPKSEPAPSTLCERWLVWDPEESQIAEFQTEAEALHHARAIVDDVDPADGWPEWVEQIMVARVTHGCEPVNERPDPSGDFDYLVDYEMRPYGSSPLPSLPEPEIDIERIAGSARAFAQAFDEFWPESPGAVEEWLEHLQAACDGRPGPALEVER